MEQKTLQSEIQDVKKFFHGYATDFDSIYGYSKKRGVVDKMMDKLFRQSMLLRYQETIEQTKKSSIKSIIDIGCGSGVYCEAFLKQGKSTIVGLDIAEGMLELAKRKVSKYPEKDRISFVLSDYMEYRAPYKFDAACLMGFFDYIKDAPEVLQKLQHDVGKEIYMSFPKKGGFLTWQRKVRYNMRNCPLYFYSLDSLKKILNESGLTNKYIIKDLGRDFFVKVTF